MVICHCGIAYLIITNRLDEEELYLPKSSLKLFKIMFQEAKSTRGDDIVHRLISSCKIVEVRLSFPKLRWVPASYLCLMESSCGLAKLSL